MKYVLTSLLLLLAVITLNAARPQVVAHRGYHHAPGSAENSIRSLVKADSIGAEQTEFDVWLSADNVLFVNHNADINGIVIETSPSAAIDTCRLPNGEFIPRLDTFLDTAATLNVGLVLEVKPHKDAARENVAIPMIIDMVAAKGLKDRTTYITFSENACRLLVGQADRPVYYLTGVEPETVEQLGATGPDFHISHFRKNPDWIKRFHSMGMPVNIWTVNSDDDIRYSVEQGVDFITTNEPELAQKIINEAYASCQLRVISYNLRFGELATMERLAEEIKAFNPDFVALQEVDINTHRAMAPHNNGVSFINELARLTGMFGYFGKTINFSGGYYGIGILSRFPADNMTTIPLPNPKNEEPRVILKGTFRLANGLPFVFASTHFDFKSADTQLLQAQCVIDNFSHTPTPALIAGDFNCTPDSPALTLMNRHFTLLSGTAPTFPAKKPTERLDYIWGLPKADFRLIETAEGPAGPDTASDHLPVMSVIEFTR